MRVQEAAVGGEAAVEDSAVLQGLGMTSKLLIGALGKHNVVRHCLCIMFPLFVAKTVPALRSGCGRRCSSRSEIRSTRTPRRPSPSCLWR